MWRTGLNASPDKSGKAATMCKIRVLLADDHELLRAGLVGLLEEEPDMEVVGEAGDGQTAVELAQRTDPDVVLMDITMPLVNGIEATRRIMRLMPRVQVIALSMHDRDSMAGAMCKAGAAAYVSKDDCCNVLVQTIRSLPKPPRVS
jgi:DNA-binding NarL/FixJ family response regulator